MLYYEINIIWAWIELPLSLPLFASLSSIHFTIFFSNIIVKGIKLSKKNFQTYLKLLKFCFKEKWKLDLKNIKVNKSKLLVF